MKKMKPIFWKEIKVNRKSRKLGKLSDTNYSCVMQPPKPKKLKSKAWPNLFEQQEKPGHKLDCNACGSDNMNSLFAKNEGETCRQFGCFGNMVFVVDGTMEEGEMLVTDGTNSLLVKNIGKAK